MNKRSLIILAACLFLSACEPIPEMDYDGCQRERVFKECMASLPAGPVSTQYNDWDEVVEQCRSHAGNVSYKEVKYIKQECR